MNYGKFVFLKTYLPRTAFEDSSSVTGIYMNIYCNQLYFETEYIVCPFCILKPEKENLFTSTQSGKMHQNGNFLQF